MTTCATASASPDLDDGLALYSNARRRVLAVVEAAAHRHSNRAVSMAPCQFSMTMAALLPEAAQ